MFIFESSNNSLVTNYRPLIKQSDLPKYLERIIVPSLLFTFKKILHSNQNGFRRGHFVDTNLLCFYNTLIHFMESGRQTDVIYTDTSKAFDFVNHSILLAKLSLFDISDPLLWIVVLV